MWLLGQERTELVLQESEPQQRWKDVFSELLTLETRFCIFACFCFAKTEPMALTKTQFKVMHGQQ